MWRSYSQLIVQLCLEMIVCLFCIIIKCHMEMVVFFVIDYICKVYNHTLVVVNMYSVLRISMVTNVYLKYNVMCMITTSNK